MEDLGDPPPAAYWLAWATAFLLIIAVVSAGVMNLSGDGSQGGLVSAASRTSGAVDGSSTTTSAPVAPAQTSTTRGPAAPTSTTLPKAASALLKALGTTAPPASTTTTAPPVTSTTATTATTSSTTTTTTTLPPRATVTVDNDVTRDFEVRVNGRLFTLGPGPDSASQTEEIDARLPNVPDEIRGNAVGEPPCQVFADGDLFRAGGRYEVTIVPDGTCAEVRVRPV